MVFRSLLKLMFLGIICFSVFTVEVFAQSFELSNGITLYQNRDFEKAISQLEKAVDKNPYGVEAYYYLAASQMGLMKYEKALSTAEEGLEVAPQNTRMLVVKAEALYHIDYPKAIPVYHQILELIEREGDDTIKKDQAEAYLGYLYKRKANDAFISGNTLEAIKVFKRARTLTPDSLSVHNNLSYILLQDERWDEALDALGIGLERFPTSEKLLLLKGQAHRGAGNTKKMVETFEVLFELFPENINYGVIYGQALMASNQATKANEHMNMLIKKYPENEQLYEALKTMSEQRFDMGTRKNVLKLQSKAFPENREVALELADTHILLKEYEKARTILDSINTVTPNPNMALRSAQTYLHEGKLDTATQIYKEVTEQWPESNKILTEAGHVFKASGNNKEALRFFKKAFEMNNDPKIAIEIIELTDSEGIEKGNRYLKYLLDSPLYSIGEYFELRFINEQNSESEEKFISSITGLLDVISESQSKFTSETESVVKGNSSPKPEILRDTKFIQKLSDYVNNWYVLLSNSYTQEKQIEILRRVMSEYPSSARLHFFLGKSAMNANKLDLAQKELEEAIRLGAKDEMVYIYLGEIQSKKQNYEEAILLFEQSLSLNSKSELAYQKLISVSEKSGNLQDLCNRWLLRFDNNSSNDIFREFLISALHKADRFEEARKVIAIE